MSVEIEEKTATAVGARPEPRAEPLVFERSGEGKVGFAVGRRLGGAVERNRARRRLREAYRRERPGKREGFDVVFVARAALLHCSFADLRGDVQRVLRTLRRRADSGDKSATEGKEA